MATPIPAKAVLEFTPRPWTLPRSQRESPRDRALSQAFKLRQRLGSEEGIGDYILKPKGMHDTTFERAMIRVEAAEDIVDAHSILLLDRLNRAIQPRL